MNKGKEISVKRSKKERETDVNQLRETQVDRDIEREREGGIETDEAKGGQRETVISEVKRRDRGTDLDLAGSKKNKRNTDRKRQIKRKMRR